jgi:predicted RNase H-like HicB family nuclease
MKNIIVFEVSQEEDGGFVAECLTENIFTQGDTWEDLKVNINEAVKGFYFDRPNLHEVNLHLVKQVTKQDILNTL